jgi:hypothetical protein
LCSVALDKDKPQLNSDVLAPVGEVGDVNDGAVHSAAEEGAGRPTHRVHLNILEKKKLKQFSK